jgi:hypothetical protein
MNLRHVLLLLLLFSGGRLLAAVAPAAESDAARRVVAGNLIYAGDKTSVCFSDRFLTTVDTEARIPTEKRLRTVRLGRWDELAAVSFAVMNGQEAFTFTPEERTNLKRWLTGGGFLLASAGCSAEQWSASLRREVETALGANSLQPVPFTHPVFHSLFPITSAPLSHGGSGRFEGVSVDGRLAVLFSPEGLNDTAHTQGCCCCGGNEVKQAEEVVANTLVYALTE